MDVAFDKCNFYSGRLLICLTRHCCLSEKLNSRLNETICSKNSWKIRICLGSRWQLNSSRISIWNRLTKAIGFVCVGTWHHSLFELLSDLLFLHFMLMAFLTAFFKKLRISFLISSTKFVFYWLTYLRV